MNNAQIASARLAIDAAQRSLREGKTATQLADELQVSRSSVTCARLILEYGTAVDLLTATSGEMGLRTLADKIRATLPEDELERLKKKTGVFTDTRRENLKAQAELWGKLNVALKNLSELPQPSDVVGVVRSNAMRENAVNSHLDIVARWMKEFAHEWERYQATKLEAGVDDTGTRDTVAGT